MYEKVRKARKEKKITIEEMAKELDFSSPSTYSKKERGDLPITIDEAQKICNKLGISPLLFF